MSFATANGAGVLTGTIELVRRGTWTAELVVDAADLEAFDGGEGPVTIVLGAQTFKGTIYRATDFGAKVGLLVVGGAHGLPKTVDRQSYQGVPASLPLGALLFDAGEVLSSTSDAATLATLLPNWARVRGPAGAALWRLVETLGVVWRVLPDGTFWVGPETWPETELDLRALEEDTERGQAVVDGDDVETLTPGVVALGRRVSLVRHHIGENVRHEVLFEGSDGVDRVTRDLAAHVEQLVAHRADFLTLYPARVVAQSGTKVDVLPDADTLPALAGIPVRGLVGQTIDVAPGARVLVGFEGGDPRQPYASPAWENGVALVSPLLKVATQTGLYPAIENVATTQSTVNLVQNVLHALALILNALGPIPLLGSVLGSLLLSPANVAIITAAIAGSMTPATGNIAAVKALLDAAIAAKVPDPTGNLPGLGCPSQLVG